MCDLFAEPARTATGCFEYGYLLTHRGGKLLLSNKMTENYCEHARSSAQVDAKKKLAVYLGISGVTIWIMVFAAGVLVNSLGYRQVLDPPEWSRAQDSTTRSATRPVEFSKIIENILPAALCYTPTNAAILCVLSALIGGCASNLVVAKEQLQKLEVDGHYKPGEIDDALQRQLAYMAESPFISMFRGFVVYLAFMAGFLIFVEDPFKNSTPSGYLRYVGTVCLIAFTMGYDPTRFADLIKRIPTLGAQGSPIATGDRTPQAAQIRDVKAVAVIQAEEHTEIVPPPPASSEPPGKRKRGNPSK